MTAADKQVDTSQFRCPGGRTVDVPNSAVWFRLSFHNRLMAVEDIDWLEPEPLKLGWNDQRVPMSKLVGQAFGLNLEELAVVFIRREVKVPSMRLACAIAKLYRRKLSEVGVGLPEIFVEMMDCHHTVVGVVQI